jgi:hypothetical protein
MPIFTLELNFQSGSGSSSQKSFWETAAKELRERGARIINVQSKVGKIGEPPRTINVVTITYEATTRIAYTGESSP